MSPFITIQRVDINVSFQIYRYIPSLFALSPKMVGWTGHKPPKRNSCHVKTPINHRELMWSIKNFNKPPFSYHILHWTNHFWWFNGGSPPVFPSAPRWALWPVAGTTRLQWEITCRSWHGVEVQGMAGREALQRIFFPSSKLNYIESNI